MKKIYISALAMAATFNFNAQVSNGGLNTWETITVGAESYERPSGPWINAIDSIAQVIFGESTNTVIEKSVSPLEGNSYASLGLDDFGFGPLGGALAYGLVNSNDSLVGVPAIPRPTGVTFSYKYFSTMGDSSVITVLANNDASGMIYELTANTTTWTALHYDFNYTGTGTDSIALIFQITDEDLMDPNLELQIDDVKYTYATGLVESLNKAKLISVYPNPSTDFINFELENSDNMRFEIYNINGALVHTSKNLKNDNQIAVSDLNNGTYIYILIDDQAGRIIDRGEFIKK